MRRENMLGKVEGAWVVTMILLTLLAFGSHVSVVAVNSPTSGGENRCEAIQQAETAKLNRLVAISNAQSFSRFRSASSRYAVVQYDSAFEAGKIDLASCVPIHLMYNVVFSAYNSLGFAGYIVVSENPSSLAPSQISLQTQSLKNDLCTIAQQQCDIANWGGYDIFSMTNGQPSQQYQANCANCNTILNAASTVNVPIPVYPAEYGPGGCVNPACVVSTWVGLTSEQGGFNDGNLAQLGVTSICQGNGCTPAYGAWYQRVGVDQFAVTCAGVNVNGGDSVYLHIQNEASVGGSNQLYDFYILDKTNGSSCTVNGMPYPQMPGPHFADYIVERPTYNGHSVMLPAFSRVYFTNSQLYCQPAATARCTPDSQFGVPNEYGIFSMTWQGWFFRDWMRNCGPGSLENVGIYNVDPSHTFEAEWETSDCTGP